LVRALKLHHTYARRYALLTWSELLERTTSTQPM
jgi:hypothetical protein